MKTLWNHRIEGCILCMAILLFLQTLLPPFLHTGIYWCLFFLVLTARLLYRLNAIHEHLHK